MSLTPPRSLSVAALLTLLVGCAESTPPQVSAVPPPWQASAASAKVVPAGSASPAVSDSGRAELSADDVQQVVQHNRKAVARACFGPVQAEGEGGKRRERVTVTAKVTVAPSGQVESVATEGGQEVPSLGPCIASKIRGWTFPSAASPTKVSIPFMFASE